MKKKFLWIAALFAALALLVTGCSPTGGGDDGGDEEEGGETTEFWVAANDTGEKLGDGKTKTLVGQTEDNYVHIFFTPLGKSFDKIKITFTFGSTGFDICWQCAYDDNGTWGQNGGDYIDWLQAGSIEVDPAVMFKSGWGTIANGATALDKASMKGICIRVTVPEGDPDATFTLTNVEFVGGSSSGGGGNDGPIVIFDGSNGGFKPGASIASSSFVTATANNITISWNSNDDPDNPDEKGAFRGKVNLASAAQADLTAYTKFKMDWSTTTDNANGSFNISLYFPGNRMLSKPVSAGTAEFNFTIDHPSWAAGTSWGGAEVGTITGFEIYSNDSSGLGTDPLVITKISFE